MTYQKLLTEEGYQKIKQKLVDLQQKKEHLVIQIEEVAQPDESGEDGLAQQLKEELEVILTKIDKLDAAVNNSKIINENQVNGTLVQVGSRVKIKLIGEAEKEFMIVDEIEADPANNKLSRQSPIGQALMGKGINDEVEVEAPVGKVTYKIISIG